MTKPQKRKKKRNKYVRFEREHPNSKIIVHPECLFEVINLANYVGGTAQMLEYTRNSEAKEFIVGTEDGLIHQLAKQNRNKTFYALRTLCYDMKLTTLESIVSSLREMEHQINVPEEIRTKGKKTIDRMLEIH